MENAGQKDKKHAWIKGTSLVLVVFQNSAVILMMRYVSTRTQKFSPASALVIVEFVKLFVCLLVQVRTQPILSFYNRLRDLMVPVV